ncbi:uncharacterized protein BYT42DRAFT_546277 [Radiomyces spectabilis]|uniref:uncharacterized protein n=1 Tax=Radiomyces spectabilis TaxID=64574 RepID=UPI00221E542C|nr:uncharacterized protein BYT42DRAFT_546277 [Radiomyces spectabilis]KAI8377614.1 hypothetical protein BYT42DRAFT_546277 [Radiomyces spectabilis]
MLYSYESAWAAYCSFFILLSVALIWRCRSNLLLLPFIGFSIFATIGLIVAITRRTYETHWIERSPVLYQWPVLSLLLFIGIIESQQVFFRHLALALYNRQRWGSLYVRDPEKAALYGRKPGSARPWTYWFNLVFLTIYTAVVIVNLCLQLVILNKRGSLASAVCTTILAGLACINAILISSGSSLRAARHLRVLRKNRQDLLFLRATPILFTLVMAGIAVEGWLYVFDLDGTTTGGWIALETMIVILTMMLLGMCLYVRKLHKLGQQYPMMDPMMEKRNSKRSLRHPQTEKQITTMISRLSQDAADRVTPPASRLPPTAQF